MSQQKMEDVDSCEVHHKCSESEGYEVEDLGIVEQLLMSI